MKLTIELTTEQIAIMLDALKDEQHREAQCGSRNIASKLTDLINEIEEQVR